MLNKAGQWFLKTNSFFIVKYQFVKTETFCKTMPGKEMKFQHEITGQT